MGAQSCPDGTFSNTTGSTACLPCPPGSTQAYPATSCTVCPAGSFVEVSESYPTGRCKVSVNEWSSIFFVFSGDEGL